jgi:hypothetical protein
MLKPGQALRPAGATVIGLRRASSIDTLAASGGLDAGQVAAAFRFRNAYLESYDAKRESLGFDEWRAPGYRDLSKTERRQAATRDLGQARALVGAYVYSLLLKVCGEGHAIADLHGARRARESHVDMLKIHLTMLSKLWNRPN